MINHDIKPTGIASAYVQAPFDIALDELQIAGYKPISLEENARLRIEQGKTAYVSGKGNLTKEGFIYIPGADKVRIVKNSPILTNSTEATQAHRKRREFYLDSISTENSIPVPYNQKAIPTSKFADEDITAFLFGSQAQAYGQFLKEAGIKQMPIYLVDRTHLKYQSTPFARQCWFISLGSGSGLDGYYRSLAYGYRLRGVRYA